MEIAERAKAFNKENYKPIKVYVKKEEFPAIKSHAESKGMKVSAYIKDLIDKDMSTGGGQNE